MPIQTWDYQVCFGFNFIYYPVYSCLTELHLYWRYMHIYHISYIWNEIHSSWVSTLVVFDKFIHSHNYYSKHSIAQNIFITPESTFLFCTIKFHPEVLLFWFLSPLVGGIQPPTIYYAYHLLFSQHRVYKIYPRHGIYECYLFQLSISIPTNEYNINCLFTYHSVLLQLFLLHSSF